MPNWRESLRDACPHVRFDEPLAPLTTFKIGGPADAFADCSTREQVMSVVRAARELSVPLFILGWGSNVLVRDRGLRGIVMRLTGDFDTIEFLANNRVRCGAAVRVPQLVVFCAEKNLSGLEPIVGVPGTVGGALAMNAGTRDGEIGSFVASVEVVDLSMALIKNFTREELVFKYREGPLRNFVALECELLLKPGSKGDIMAAVGRYQQKRLQTQPIHTFNVGSIFKNPPGRFAAQMIEELALKGRALGGARVSPTHANFIENFAGAKSLRKCSSTRNPKL
jgi:UDP-N-acetylmuramate dehydrogenase